MSFPVSQLDIEQPEQLVEYLRGAGHIGPHELPAVRPLYGGVSNRTVWVQRENGEAWVLKQALEKLRVAVDWFCSPERIHREALGIHWLARVAPAGSIPALIFEDGQQNLPAMEAVPEPHDNWKTLLLAGNVSMQLAGQFGEMLGIIHRASHEQSNVFAEVFADSSFFEALRLEPYYNFSAVAVPEAADFLNELMQQTRARRLSLVHGDYSPKNVLVRDGKMILLDHEVIHWGDPAFDVGFALAHFLSKAHHLEPHRSAFAGAAATFWEAYRFALDDAFGCGSLEAFAVRHSLACLLARVAGRSTLEYLSHNERECQRDVVVDLMRTVPASVPELIHNFTRRLEARGKN